MIASNITHFTILEFMKRFTLVFIFFSLILSVSAQEIDQKRIDFVNKFYKAVVSHKKSKVIKCTDKDYRKEQIKFLGGNKQQFVDELFGGFDIETKEYVNLKLIDIENIEVQDVHDLESGGWEYVFHVKSKGRTTKLTLGLKKSGKKYGFIGAVG